MRALWIALASLLVLRGLFTMIPNMWGWGLNVSRFESPQLAWPLWALMALSLIAAAWRPLAARIDSWFAAAGRAPLAWSVVLVVVIASLSYALPDRIQFTGDFKLREGTVALSKDPALLFPQAMPLDVWLHVTLPRWLMTHSGMDAAGAGRALDALEAGVFAVLAIAFARTLALPPAAAAATAVAVAFGGYLGLFTGYSKSFAELCLVTLAMGVFGERAVRTGRGLLPLGIAAALGIALHRSGLVFMPALLVAWALWATRHGRNRWRSLTPWLGIALPVVTAVLLVPHIAQQIVALDTDHLLPGSVRRDGLWATLLGGTRPVDLINLIVLLAPLAPLLLVLAAPLAPRLARRGEGWVLWAIALPLAGAMLLLHPRQGTFRDWDCFAPLGVALAMLAAALAAEVLRSSRSPRAALALATALAAVVPSVQWLAHLHDAPAGEQRIEAFVNEAPPRAPEVLATTWDFLAMHYFRHERWEESARASERAVHFAANPRLILQWGMAETMLGRYDQAQQLYARATELNPEFTMAWLGLASASSYLGDVATCERAADQLRRLSPHHPRLPDIDAFLARSRRGM